MSDEKNTFESSKNIFTKLNGDEVILTDDEMKIVRALKRLDLLWSKHGDNLLLFNGDSLRYQGTGCQHEIWTACGITGDGGDGGDEF